jgi:hypothetical protein
MGRSVAQRVVIREARKQTLALRKPPEVIRSDLWRNIQSTLCAIAEHLPDPWPSERLLAKRLKTTHQQVHRWVSRAEQLGLIERRARLLPGSQRPGVKYVLRYLSDDLKAAAVRLQPDNISRQQYVPEVVPYSVGDRKNPLPSVGSSRGRAVPARRGENMNRWTPEPDGPVIGEDTTKPLPSSAVRTDPARFLAAYFDKEWAKLSEFRGVPASDRGRAVGYLRKVMLDHMDFALVQGFIDAFMDEARSGGITLKDGQNAWAYFTGWWSHQTIEDPEEKRREQEEHRAAWARYDAWKKSQSGT